MFPLHVHRPNFARLSLWHSANYLHNK